MTSDDARRYLMIGAPVTSVRTPPLLERYFESIGVQATVAVEHVEPGALKTVVAGLRETRDLDGLLVTMPHKRAIAALLDDLTAPAAAAGSVNAVKRLGDRLVGAQFDGIGLREALLARGVDLASSRIWLAGPGGAGLAITEALLAGGSKVLFLREPDDHRWETVAAPLGVLQRVEADGVPMADVLVNATPLGMQQGDPSPFPGLAVRRARLVADIVADPCETRLAADAAAAGRPLVTGREMVASQVPPIGRWLLSDTLTQDS
jgi:shikimate dehydrogenase